MATITVKFDEAALTEESRADVVNTLAYISDGKDLGVNGNEFSFEGNHGDVGEVHEAVGRLYPQC